MLHLAVKALAQAHLVPNLVRSSRFVSFPFLTFFPLNDNALSKHGGMVALCFSFLIISLHTC